MVHYQNKWRRVARTMLNYLNNTTAMNIKAKPSCPDCGSPIIDTRHEIQPYDDLDNYTGFRCSECKKTFTDEEIQAMD